MAAQHRGETLLTIIRKNGVNQTQLARDLGMSRSNLYRRYEVANLSPAFLRQVGAAIGLDLSGYFPELRSETNVVAEPLAAYEIPSPVDCQQRLLQVLEQFAEKVRQYDELKARYDALLSSQEPAR
ncbi:transcriptional regulator with XRE-family HTH domain [Hymenobacter luteus]|uniref:Transcriptional regulator with XRE-family HTH domain n=2 Tax=Hymenobacter TaxID=89966 RepID=A0A7W9WAD9_9BACT|nr:MULTISPECIES: helix-turn-helix transcriptional regulator [Hymenobacter]MBB4600444.1 transcriptional regulator with XRE-family HTH domain [Hymenobacter latericoloratus]MBB6057246.1 transcriptional regulator with XRE-family HTH domain [Hymenobacter luteus]